VQQESGFHEFGSELDVVLGAFQVPAVVSSYSLPSP
jgi:hypothetical protein